MLLEQVEEEVKDNEMIDVEETVEVEEDNEMIVPDPEVLLERFDKLIDFYKNIRDAKTGEEFLRDKALEAAKNLRVHIAAGCCSDVPNVPLYYYICEDEKLKIPRYRCIRGTNKTENYHRHLKNVFHKFTVSPKLAHMMLLEFNSKWNFNDGRFKNTMKNYESLGIGEGNP